MSHTIKVKGSVINNPDDNNIGKAHFVHCVATGGTQTGVVDSITVDTQGIGYTTATVSFTGGGGAGAAGDIYLVGDAFLWGCAGSAASQLV